LDAVDALQKHADGVAQRASTGPSVGLAGVTCQPGDVIAELRARIAPLQAVSLALASGHGTVRTDEPAVAQLGPLLSTRKQVLLAVRSTQLDILADLAAEKRAPGIAECDPAGARPTLARWKPERGRLCRGSLGTMLTGLDHVTIAVQEIEGAVDAYERLLGMPPSWCGAHPALGTEGALVALSNAAVELVAPKPNAEESEGLRARLAARGEGLTALAFCIDAASDWSKALRERGLRATASP
jgi:glyoxalase-like protein